MVNQTAISVKIDNIELDRLDSLCKNLGCKRNKLINFAIHMINENMSCNISHVNLVSVYDSASKYILF